MEKMTAVWLIILTVLVCAAVPAVLIYLTTTPKMLLGTQVAEHLVLMALTAWQFLDILFQIAASTHDAEQINS